MQTLGHTLLATILLVGWTNASAEDGPKLAFPLNCELGRTCFLQNYVDRDPSPSAKDYMCGSMTYDGHNGTDFRLPSMVEQRAGVDVLASASGQVLRTRDGVPDVSIRDLGREAVQGTECGNGVVIDHGSEWQTQYCHLADRSIRVAAGDKVAAGQPIGKVGLSGLTEYPHLHLTIRHKGQVIDPFDTRSDGLSCMAGASIWSGSMATLDYQGSAVINSGFASAPITNGAIEGGTVAPDGVGNRSAAIVAYVRAIGLRAGDSQELAVTDPAGRLFSKTSKRGLDRPQAQYILFTGKRRGSESWATGRYEAIYTVRRNGAIAVEHTFQLELHEGT